MTNDKYFRPKARLVLFSETRTEWLLATYGGFQVILTLEFLPRFQTSFNIFYLICKLLQWFWSCFDTFYLLSPCNLITFLSLLSPCILILVLFQHSLTIVTLYTNLGYISALFILVAPCILILVLFQHSLSIIILYTNLYLVSALFIYCHPVY